ncbi:MAG: hypothetical protein IJD58_13405 [Lachnospiraceae bacterium]|nr:hypothetical protein [Lachnospiraceae bacterium]
MTNTNFFKLVQCHLEEREYNNVYENLMKDKNYLKAYQHHKEMMDKYENLDLPFEQRKFFNELIDAIHSQECAYTAVLFRMAMQYGFSIVWELLDMK